MVRHIMFNCELKARFLFIWGFYQELAAGDEICLFAVSPMFTFFNRKDVWLHIKLHYVTVVISFDDDQ